MVGSDLSIGTTGDLATADGSAYVQARVLRRLVTNQGGYIWNLSYGGGLPGFVGTTPDPASLATAIRNQMLLEASVARSPVPTVAVVSMPDGSVTLTVTYAETATGASRSLTFTPGS